MLFLKEENLIKAVNKILKKNKAISMGDILIE